MRKREPWISREEMIADNAQSYIFRALRLIERNEDTPFDIPFTSVISYLEKAAEGLEKLRRSKNG